MMAGNVRPATHAGSWYSGDGQALAEELGGHLQRAADAPNKPRRAARIVVAPHAGYRYCAPTAAYSFGALDPDVQRVYVLGPSHHTRIDGCRGTPFGAYATPLGNLRVDSAELQRVFGATATTTSEDVDEEEHSLEMCCPWIARVAPRASVVPVMVGSLSAVQAAAVGRALGQALQRDPKCAVVVSSDFCHYGRRFGFASIGSQFVSQDGTLGGQIEALDKAGVSAIQSGDPAAWSQYIAASGNTVCGRSAILLALHAARESGIPWAIDLGSYTQSSRVRHPSESSVSYASIRFVPT
jgi:AmmeMemoRadiSam system protein B